VGSQGLSLINDELFTDLKGHFVFKCLDDLTVYLCSVEEHSNHICVVLQRLESEGFTLNPDKITITAGGIKYLGHQLSQRGISVLSDRVAAIRSYPCPTNLRTLRRFLGMIGFYARFIPNYSKCAVALHALKKKGARFVWTHEY
jgi:hypothetical protein